MTHVVTPKNKMKLSISNLRTLSLLTIATMSAECAFRFSNFKIRGTFHSSVPLFTSSDNKESLGSHIECMQVKLLCVFLRVKLDQYARSVRANVLNIQIVVCGCTLKDSQQVLYTSLVIIILAMFELQTHFRND